jgi:multiple sugar transport system ATP-binding protein
VVYVTHDQTEAMTLSTKVAVLNDGLVQQLDPPERIYNQPANLFVAGFVGSPQMNLLTLPCKGRYAMLGDAKILLPNLPTVPPEIILGIRPEHVRIPQPDDTQTIQGQVYLVENLGMHNLVSVRVASSETEPFTCVLCYLQTKNGIISRLHWLYHPKISTGLIFNQVMLCGFIRD